MTGRRAQQTNTSSLFPFWLQHRHRILGAGCPLGSLCPHPFLFPLSLPVPVLPSINTPPLPPLPRVLMVDRERQQAARKLYFLPTGVECSIWSSHARMSLKLVTRTRHFNVTSCRKHPVSDTTKTHVMLPAEMSYMSRRSKGELETTSSISTVRPQRPYENKNSLDVGAERTIVPSKTNQNST